MYKQDLALNNQQWLKCHQEKPNQTKPKNNSSTFLHCYDSQVNFVL